MDETVNMSRTTKGLKVIVSMPPNYGITDRFVIALIIVSSSVFGLNVLWAFTEPPKFNDSDLALVALSFVGASTQFYQRDKVKKGILLAIMNNSNPN